jgi:hypothetical protein
MDLMSSVSSARLPAYATPLILLIPLQVDRTTALAVGVSIPAAWWATEIADIRRRTVAVFAVRARSVMYSATVSGSAGRAPRPWSAHHDEKHLQSLA